MQCCPDVSIHDLPVAKTASSAIIARSNSSSLRSLNIFCIRVEGDTNKNMLIWLMKTLNTECFNFISFCVVWFSGCIYLHVARQALVKSCVNAHINNHSVKNRSVGTEQKELVCKYVHQRNHTGIQPWGEVNFIQEEQRGEKWKSLRVSERIFWVWQISYERDCNTMSKACCQSCQSVNQVQAQEHFVALFSFQRKL